MGGPTSRISYRQHSSRDHMTTQAPPLRQSRDTFVGICPTYKEYFQVHWDNSIPLLLHAAIYLEVSLFQLNQSECIFPRNSRTVQMTLCAKLQSSIAHSIICTLLFRRKMHSDWFNGIEMLQGRWQHGEIVGYYCILSSW